jgi:FKBP-type peptidyl-prolyl cis-trans isomerase
MNATTTLYISDKGNISTMPKSEAYALHLSDEDCAAALTKHLSEAALAVFVSDALKLAKPLARLQKTDKRIAQAVQALCKEHAETQEPAKVAAKKAATKKAPKSTTAPAKKPEKEHKVGAKRMIYDLLKAGKKHTLEQFAKITGSSESNCRTAITDLKNPKYAVNKDPLKVAHNKQGVYALMK